MRYDKQYLLSLIPAIYRLRDYVRDESPHGPLEALIDAIAGQVGGIELNIEQLYDDLFIETCADWVVPYLGDMIGYQPLSGATAAVSSPRAEVANTIGYRRRKGTLTVIEMLAADVTGWPAAAIECFTRLAQTEHLDHIRLNRTSTASLREPLPSLVDQPVFLDLPHSIDVRSIASRRGLWNIPNIAVYLYRLEAFSMTGGTPFAVDRGNPQRFTFHPLGVDSPLYQPARPLGAGEARPSGPSQLPGPARRRLLYAELQQRRALIAAGAGPGVLEEEAVGFTAVDPVARISVAGVAIDPQFIQVCDLSLWTPSALVGIRASIDPKLGRFVLAADPAGARVEVDYCYGFPGEYGAGAYARNDPSAAVDVAPGDDLSAAVSAAIAPGDADVRVPNSSTYPGDLAITLAPDHKLMLRAGSRNRPVIGGTLTITLGANASFTLVGFVVGGGVVVTGGPGAVDIQQCTLRPSAAGAVSWQGSAGGRLTIAQSLSGPLRLDPLVQAAVSRSVIDAGGDMNPAIASTAGAQPAGALSLDSVTVAGTIQVREMDLVQNSLLTGVAVSTRTQQGCVRFTYLPRTSVTPPRYECQPETAARLATAAALQSGASAATIALLNAQVTARVRPEFTSLNIGNPAYAQLGPRCAAEIRGGAEDGSEMGIYHPLEQIQRENNLRKRIGEYLRISLEAGIFYAQ
jgi:hypothetical protein